MDRIQISRFKKLRNLALIRQIAGVAILACGVSGCALVVPKDGPTNGAIGDNAVAKLDHEPDGDKLKYALVKLSPEVISEVNAYTAAIQPRFPTSLGRIPQADVRINAGDRVSITIYEASAGGLFIPSEAGSRAGNFVQVPAQQVDPSGNIVAPYAGTIHAAGRVASDISNEIVAKLRHRAIEPQVVLSIDERRSSEVAVLGEVNSSIKFSLDPGGTRILAALARAGGNRYPDYETDVVLQRNRQTYRSTLRSITRDSKQNIQVEAGDVIYVAHQPHYFLVLGATPYPGTTGGSSTRRYTFDDDQVSLSEAIAKAGGLNSSRANPSAVFVYRIENRTTLEKLSVDVSAFNGNDIPTIYSIDMRRGDGLFLAQGFQMRNRDNVFAADTDSVDLVKLTDVINAVNFSVGGVKATINEF